MKNHLLASVLGTALVFGVQSASAQYGSAPAEHIEGRLDAARAARNTPAPAAGKPGEKQPVTAVLAKDNKGKKTATTFTSADPQVFLVWKDPTAMKGDTIKVVWIAEDVKGFKKNTKLSEGSKTLPGDGGFSSDFFLNAEKGGLPAGKYRAELYDGSKRVENLSFTITK